MVHVSGKIISNYKNLDLITGIIIIIYYHTKFVLHNNMSI